MNSIGIIGAGAAGIMAAMTAKLNSPQSQITIFDKNTKLGVKVIISGGGRCNVTTGLQNINEILEKYPRGKRFLKHSMYEFSPKHVFNFFEHNGVPLKIEKDLRVFPKSNNGNDIVNVFTDFFKKENVTLYFNTEIKTVKKTKNMFKLLDSNNQGYEFDKLILTTGGQAYRETGSCGDGYTFAESLGHTITELGPSLTSLLIDKKWCNSLSGVSHENAQFKTKDQMITGPFLWTHKGITGPAIFAISAYLAFEKFTKQNPLILNLDLIPNLNEQAVTEHCLNFVKNNGKKKTLLILSGLIPKSVTAALLSQNNINPEKKCNEIKHSDVRKFAQNIKQIELPIIGRSSGTEFVTAGGVDTKEINSKTMESKICPNLFFAGEILNIDGFTGGFNLQAAFATGHLSGINCT